MYNAIVRVILPAVIGALLGGGAVAYVHRNDVTSAAGQRPASSADAGGARDDLGALRADVARLKTNAPSQSHTMSDVGYHWTNLWFAAEKKNWPLAQFYFEESRAHLLWTIQLRPVRKGPDGNDVNLDADLRRHRHERVQGGCRCHPDRQFSRVRGSVPRDAASLLRLSQGIGQPLSASDGSDRAGQSIINVDAAATWPQ